MAKNITKNKKTDMEFADTLESILNGTASAEDKSRVKGTLQAFFTKPLKMLEKKRAAIQAFTVSTDMPKIVQDAFTVTIAEDNFDMGWEAAFREIQLGPFQDSWEIFDVTNAFSIKKIPEGMRVKIESQSGSGITAGIDYYGGAIGFTDKAIRYRKLNQIVDSASAFRNTFWRTKAQNHYDLIRVAAAANTPTAYQGGATDSRIQRDIDTINEAIFTLTDGLKDKGYGDMANAPLVMYANPKLRKRLEAAYGASSANLTQGSQAGTPTVPGNPVQRIYTFSSNITTTQPVFCLPGQKSQLANDMEPTSFPVPKDSLTLNVATALWAIYGAICADTDQFQPANFV